MDDLVGVVLGAGSSRRLGRPKQTLAFGGETLLSHVMGDIEAAESLGRVYLVLGGGSEEAEASVTLRRARIVRNDAYGTGCASSLLAGLDAAGTCDAIVMLLGDMPGVTAEIIDQVLATWRGNPTWAAVTDYRGQLGHPFVFSSAAFDQLRRLHGDKAVWKIVDREPVTRVARIPSRHQHRPRSSQLTVRNTGQARVSAKPGEIQNLRRNGAYPVRDLNPCYHLERVAS